MKITEKMAQELVEVLEEVKEEYFSEEKSKYPYAEGQQKREQVKQRLRELPRYIDQAAEKIHFVKPQAGQKKKIDVRKRTMLFLFTRLMNKSNRDPEELLVLFEPLFGITASTERFSGRYLRIRICF